MSNFTQAHEQNFLVFDLLIGGHHASYIQHLVEYWCLDRKSCNLNIVVSPQFFIKHNNVVEIVSECPQKNINLVAISPEEAAALNSNSSPMKRILRAIDEWKLLCQYAKSLKATHCLIMYFDTCWLPLILGKKAPCNFSGIYFRPTLHYRTFANYSASGEDWLQLWREKFTLKRILRHPQLQTLFSIDPFAPKYINQKFNSQVKVIPLADPVKMPPAQELPTANFKDKLNIESSRKVFLLFGALTGRKGFNQLLTAISLLPSNICQQICLLLVGEGNQETIQMQVEHLRQTTPIQIIGKHQFVPESDVPKYFQLADFILAPYQKHVGMSGILLLAAAAQKPIVSSDYGLMGELVRRYRLGIAIDSTIPNEIAKGIVECLHKSPEELGDRHLMKIFAEQNSAERFAQVIFQELLS